MASVGFARTPGDEGLQRCRGRQLHLGLVWQRRRGEGGWLDSPLMSEICRPKSGAEVRRGEGALAEGRKIYEMIGARALFGWTVVRNKSQSFRVSSA